VTEADVAMLLAQMLINPLEISQCHTGKVKAVMLQEMTDLFKAFLQAVPISISTQYTYIFGGYIVYTARSTIILVDIYHFRLI
jgi:hypothetical protein